MVDEFDPQVASADCHRNRMADVVIRAMDAQCRQFPSRPQLSRIPTPWLYRNKGSYELVDLQRLLGFAPRLPFPMIGLRGSWKPVISRFVADHAIENSLIAHENSAESPRRSGIVQMDQLQSI
jgi:hypothetical protein